MYLPRYGLFAPRKAYRFLHHCALLLVAAWVAPAAASNTSSRFEYLRAANARVANVAYGLAISNRELCREALAPRAGFILHDIAQYDLADRQGAARVFGFGSHIGVMAVVGGSPAQRAGLRADDQLESVNGRVLGTGGVDRPATVEFVERARRIVAEEMRKGELILRVSGADGRREIRFTAEAGCPSDVELVPGTAVNAWANGERVMLTDTIVAKCKTDDNLALVIAHEMAHNILHHRQRLALAGISNSRLLPISAVGLAMVRETEAEADRFAVRMTRAAGYDLSQATSFLGGLLAANGLSGEAASTHPQAGRRLALLNAEIDASPDRIAR